MLPPEGDAFDVTGSSPVPNRARFKASCSRRVGVSRSRPVCPGANELGELNRPWSDLRAVLVHKGRSFAAAPGQSLRKAAFRLRLAGRLSKLTRRWSLGTFAR